MDKVIASLLILGLASCQKTGAGGGDDLKPPPDAQVVVPDAGARTQEPDAKVVVVYIYPDASPAPDTRATDTLVISNPNPSGQPDASPAPDTTPSSPDTMPVVVPDATPLTVEQKLAALIAPYQNGSCLHLYTQVDQSGAILYNAGDGYYSCFLRYWSTVDAAAYASSPSTWACNCVMLQPALDACATITDGPLIKAYIEYQQQAGCQKPPV